MPESVPSTDILRLFREDLDHADRVEAFRQASQQIGEEVKELATRPNVKEINANYDIQFVFNNHGNGIDAGQSLREIQNPFITFVENAGDADISENWLFKSSTQNAFNVTFNGSEPLRPPYPLTPDSSWQYWRDRGLLAKGSIIMPVDIRHYSRRLLDALSGSDYDQRFLSSSVPMYELTSKPFDQLLEEQKNKGLMVMYSNAVRELTSTKQIIETLLLCRNPEALGDSFEPQLKDKIAALAQKRRPAEGRLAASIIYGSGHHSMVHALRGLGIEAGRVFPGKVDAPDRFMQLGTTKDQFFASHPFKTKKKELEERTDRYARQHIIESILWSPIDNYEEFGLVPASDEVFKDIWYKIAYVARRPDLVERAEELVADFKTDHSIPVKILADYGIILHPVSA